MIKAVAPAVAVAPVKTVVPAAEPFDPNPQYSYTYSVADSITGDAKTASVRPATGISTFSKETIFIYL